MAQGAACYAFIKFQQAYQNYIRRTNSLSIVSASPFVLDINEPSLETKKLAIDELRETPENIAQGLQELKELLNQDNTMHYETDDEFLKIFLRPNKYYAKSAYDLMKRIANYREKYKDLFYNLVPEDEKDTFVNYDVVNILTDRDQNGRRILVINAGKNWDTSKVSGDQLIKCLYLLQLAALLEPVTQIHGLIVIMNFKDMGMRQVSAFTPGFSMKLMTFIQYAMPLRFKELHMVNNPAVFNIAWKIVKPLQTKKLSKRTYFHSNNMTSLHKYVNPDVLPENFGGKKEKINYGGKEWFPVMQGHLDFITKWNSCGNIIK